MVPLEIDRGFVSNPMQSAGAQEETGFVTPKRRVGQRSPHISEAEILSPAQPLTVSTSRCAEKKRRKKKHQELPAAPFQQSLIPVEEGDESVGPMRRFLSRWF